MSALSALDLHGLALHDGFEEDWIPESVTHLEDVSMFDGFVVRAKEITPVSTADVGYVIFAGQLDNDDTLEPLSIVLREYRKAADGWSFWGAFSQPAEGMFGAVDAFA